MKKLSYRLAGLVAVCLITTLLQAQTPDWLALVSKNVNLDSAISAGIFVTDINNDHYPDVVTVWGDNSLTSPDNLRVYMNVRDTAGQDPSARMFVDVTGASGINASPVAGIPSKGTLIVALADVNNDGNVDLVKGNYYHSDPAMASGDRCEVMLGDGQGGFAIVPDNGLHELGVINTIGFSFLDYNKDGNIDLFIARWFDHYAVNPNQTSPGILMKGNGDGTFTDVSVQAGINIPEPMYGCSVVDWNNDGWPDIATAPYCRTSGQLWKNNGNGTFTNVAVATGYNARYMPGDNGQGLCMWNAVPEDFDNDGDMDFFFTLVHGGNDANEGRSAVALNGGVDLNYKLTIDRSITTRNLPKSTHHGDYDASWLDMDNDGLMDLVMTQGHYVPATDRIYVFHQQQDHTLIDISSSLGLIRPELMDMHSLEALDFDLDGDDDIITRRNGIPRSLHLIENRIGQDNNWTAVTLQAPQGVNKSCIGARIYVWVGGAYRMRDVYAGRGNASGQQPFALIFGLGNQTEIDSIIVAWPDEAGTRTTVIDPPVNHYLQITGTGLAVGGQAASENNTIVLKCYPNPAKDFILLQLSDNEHIEKVRVYDVTGRSMTSVTGYNNSSATWYCSVTNLPPGHYFVQVVTEKGNTYSHSFVKVE